MTVGSDANRRRELPLVFDWFSMSGRRWRPLKNTPLAALADALVRRGPIYGKLLELGLSTTTPDRRSKFRECGFDTQNGWYWLDMAVDRSVLDAWLDSKKQQQVRSLLQTRLVYFKPKGEVIRVWWTPRGNKGARAAGGS